MRPKNSLIAITSIVSLVLAFAIILPCIAVSVQWSSDTRLTYDDKDDWMPSTAASIDGNIWVVWRKTDFVGGALDYNIYYSFFDGVSWSADTRLTMDPNCEDSYPSVAATSDGKIWVVWTSNKTGDQNLYYKVFDGVSWSADTQLTTDPSADVYPSVMEADDGKIWVTWTSNRIGIQADVFYKVFDGVSWSDDVQLTTDLDVEDTDPSIAQAADGMIWVVFIKTFDSKEADLYCRRFNGTTWSVDVQLTWDVHYDLHPSVLGAEDGTVWVFWDSDRNENDENIYYKVLDGVWSSDIKLTTNMAVDEFPSITQGLDGTFWVFWGTMRVVGNIDVYYKKSTSYARHDVAITEITASPLMARRSENVSIQVAVQNEGTFSEVFGVSGYANSTLVDLKAVSLSAGQIDTVQLWWNTSGVALGKYRITVIAEIVAGETDIDDNSREAESFVEVRIMGDVTGMYDGVLLPVPNGVVDLDDFLVVAMPGHIWTEDPTWDPVWGPVCDINRDGHVGIDDLMIVGIHFGET